MFPFKITDTKNTYSVARDVTGDEIVSAALDILAARLPQTAALTDPNLVKEYLITQFAKLEHEVFACLFLDNRHRVIRYEEIFRGTVDGCSVHPREVVKAAMSSNAAAMILAHNHPSGVAEPSRADTQLTRRLTDALGLRCASARPHCGWRCRDREFCGEGAAMNIYTNGVV